MSKELVIGCNRHETKVAVLEDDQLVEIYFQRANEYSLAGSIHKGRVTRVLPGMQSAFVDLGLERDTFLYVSDFFEENEDVETFPDEKPVRTGRDRAPVREFPPERTSSVAEMDAAPPELIVPVALPFESTVASSVADPPVTQPLGETRSNDRPDGDRGLRGDRRGRGRRRRSRGQRGIPDQKYAQPGALHAPPESQDFRPEEDTVASPSDVIILPGESLAKYRTFAASSAFVPPEELPFETVPEPLAAPGEEEQELEERMEEIELSDAVLANRSELPDSEAFPGDGELSAMGFEEIPLYEADVEDEPVTFETEPEELLTHKHSEPAALFLVSTIEEEERPKDAADPSLRGHFEESETVIVYDSEFEYERGPITPEPLPFGLLEDDELGEPGEELAFPPEGGHGASYEGAAAAAPGAETTEAQSATVREQGGRFMHRMSRRMRRRRGGNRSSEQNQEGGSEPTPSGPTLTTASAAPAMRNESRSESRNEPRNEPRNEVRAEERGTDKPDRVMPSITDLLKAGQEIIVQIAKEPLGQKGARITSHIALPGRYVVFMPSVNHLGVSRKVGTEEERQRLKRILQKHRVGTTGGFIVRTAGEGVTEDEIASDMNFLYTLWLDIRQKAEKKPAPALLHYDLDVVQRILRDQVTDEFKAIWVDNEDMYESVLSFMQRFQPALVSRVKMYTRSAPIFDAFNITQELEKALRPKVWLKSGGYIVINQTEALVAIDINTGKYVGKSNRLEDTIVKTNTEAVKEIVRQVRLRDLGGIIVVDFIDMDERKNRQKVMQALEEAMRSDKAPYKILQFNDFGLVAITRKRVKQSLERALCSPCPYCEGAGSVKSVQTVISEILIEAQKIARAIEGKDVVLRVHPDIAKILKANTNKYLEELEEILGRPVLVSGDATLHHEKFDLG